MPLTVTALYAALAGLWVILLIAAVSRRRLLHKVDLGDGGVASLGRAIRAHGNAVETIPLGLILLGLAEGLATPIWILHALGLMLIVGRVMHGVHFLTGRPDNALRFWGMTLTVAMLGLTAVGLLGHAAYRLGAGSGA